MSAYDNLDPDWIRREMDEAASDYAMAHEPRADEKLSQFDSGKLLRKMIHRYRCWTGRSLSEDVRAHDAVIAHIISESDKDTDFTPI